MTAPVGHDTLVAGRAHGWYLGPREWHTLLERLPELARAGDGSDLPAFLLLRAAGRKQPREVRALPQAERLRVGLARYRLIETALVLVLAEADAPCLLPSGRVGVPAVDLTADERDRWEVARVHSVALDLLREFSERGPDVFAKAERDRRTYGAAFTVTIASADQPSEPDAPAEGGGAVSVGGRHGKKPPPLAVLTSGPWASEPLEEPDDDVDEDDATISRRVALGSARARVEALRSAASPADRALIAAYVDLVAELGHEPPDSALAERLGLTPATVRKRLSRLRQRASALPPSDPRAA